MGWLDHSTNNIILDAVLTDYGRQQLSLSNSSFNITHFSFGDDEVDYSLIKKYGRAVGKEKIEKNTPIFEALTNPSIALKYKLIGRENVGTAASQVYLPILTTSPTSVTLSNTLTAINLSQAVTISLKYRGSTNAADVSEVAQTSYSIRVSDRFCVISNPTNGSLSSIDAARSTISSGDPGRIATYVLSVNDTTQVCSFTIQAKTLDNTTKTVYGKKTGVSERTINFNLSITGNRHGITKDVPVSYVFTA